MRSSMHNAFVQPPIISPVASTMPDVILVTGGTGLVGRAIEHVINTEPEGSRFGKHKGETWVFAASTDGDLR